MALPIGLGLLLVASGWTNFDEGSGGLGEKLAGWAMFFVLLLGAPTVLGMFAAIWYGIALTFRFRHATLVVLSAVTIVCGGGLIIALPYTQGWNGGTDPPIVDYALGIALWIYIAANIFIPAWWFMNGRRNYRMRVTPSLPSSSITDPPTTFPPA